MHASTVTPATTATVTLYALPGTKYIPRRPLTIQLEQDEGGAFVVSEPATGVFHYDASWSTALEGFVSAFVSQFEFLSSKEGHLSLSLCAELDQFRHLITLQR
jgi:hypothetical protein